MEETDVLHYLAQAFGEDLTEGLGNTHFGVTEILPFIPAVGVAATQAMVFLEDGQFVLGNMSSPDREESPNDEINQEIQEAIRQSRIAGGCLPDDDGDGHNSDQLGGATGLTPPGDRMISSPTGTRMASPTTPSSSRRSTTRSTHGVMTTTRISSPTTTHDVERAGRVSTTEEISDMNAVGSEGEGHHHFANPHTRPTRPTKLHDAKPTTPRRTTKSKRKTSPVPADRSIKKYMDKHWGKS